MENKSIYADPAYTEECPSVESDGRLTSLRPEHVRGAPTVRLPTRGGGYIDVPYRVTADGPNSD